MDSYLNVDIEEVKNDVHVIIANDYGQVHGKGRGLVHGRVHVQVHGYRSGGNAHFSNWRQLYLK